MSSNQTANYGLHVWEPEDDFSREEINENFALLDGAVRMVFGSYTGDGETSRFIELGFTPKIVFVLPCDGSIYDVNHSIRYGGIAGTGLPAQGESGQYQYIVITENGFELRRLHMSGGSYLYDVNRKTSLYYYLVVR